MLETTFVIQCCIYHNANILLASPRNNFFNLSKIILHYYFLEIDHQCKEFDSGTALHIACLNGSFKSVELLVRIIKKTLWPLFMDGVQLRQG